MRYCLLFIFIVLTGLFATAHPLPSSVVKLSVLDQSISGEAKMPLGELENALGREHITTVSDPFFKPYFTAHIRAASNGKPWLTHIESLTMTEDNDPAIGKYKQVIVRFTMVPPALGMLRNFTLYYDAIIHQVVTHKALVYIEADWSNGIQQQEDMRQAGIIKTDISTGKIYPLKVALAEGSLWKGFVSMLKLGVQHIKEGTDHLLFLIVLLLPSMLLLNGKQWGQFGGLRFSISHLLKIVTAFTIGHSVTLLLGAMGWLRLPGQPVEVLIAVSILVSAIHCVYPVFPGKETLVAAGFGLIHGSAFASVLANLNLGAQSMALSILGFNLGIELMQLFIIALIVPWLILLSRTGVYKNFRIAGATVAGITALAWIAERISGTPNFITGWIEEATPYSGWFIAALACFALAVTISSKYVLKPAKKFAAGLS